jgi:hypothetical protein
MKNPARIIDKKKNYLIKDTNKLIKLKLSLPNYILL